MKSLVTEGGGLDSLPLGVVGKAQGLFQLCCSAFCILKALEGGYNGSNTKFWEEKQNVFKGKNTEVQLPFEQHLWDYFQNVFFFNSS